MTDREENIYLREEVIQLREAIKNLKLHHLKQLEQIKKEVSKIKDSVK